MFRLPIANAAALYKGNASQNLLGLDSFGGRSANIEYVCKSEPYRYDGGLGQLADLAF
jgi:hypothetical protein